MDEQHIHDWHTLDIDRLICHKCRTITDLSVLLHNTAVDAVKQTKVDMYARLLFNRELKKKSHDRLYGWIMEQKGIIEPPIARQQRLL